MIAANNGAFPWRGTAAAADLETAAARRVEGGEADEEVRLLHDRLTREAIAAQIEAGLDVVTDGLVRHSDPVSYMVTRLRGMTTGDLRDGFPGSAARFPAPVAEAEVAWSRPIFGEDYLFASRGVSKTLKPVLVGPFTLAKVSIDRAYGDPMALAMGLATALNQELKSLQVAGASLIQVDEPALLHHKDDFPIFTRLWEVLGRGVSATLCLHLEGGDVRGIYPGVTRLKRLGCLSLDCVRGRDNLDLVRSAPYPEGLQLGLGLVDGTAEAIESVEEIKSRLGRPEGLPPRDRVILGPASGLGTLARETAAAKLRNLARAARELSAP
jgi:5-methyltetrahydropteroyltriglutamate--homocysteine methyltransferase